MEFWPLEILDYLRRNENPEDIQYGYDEDSLKQLCAECEFENISDDGSRDFPDNFETIEVLEEPEDPQQQKMQAATPEQRQAADASKKILDARHVDDEETSLKKSKQAATPEQRQTADKIKKICDAMKKIREARHVDDEETYLKKSEQKMQAVTPEQRQAAEAVKKICDESKKIRDESKKIRDARHVDDEDTSMKKSEQEATPEQRQAADAVNNVLEEMIQLPASKKICDAHHVDVDILTKVLENLKNSITQEALIQLQMQAATPEQRKAADAVNNVLEEMIQLPASEKICYAHHVDVDILTKVLENLKNSITQETLIQLQAHEQQERKGKLTRYMPDSADAGPSKMVRYAHDL